MGIAGISRVYVQPVGIGGPSIQEASTVKCKGNWKASRDSSIPYSLKIHMAEFIYIIFRYNKILGMIYDR